MGKNDEAKKWKIKVDIREQNCVAQCHQNPRTSGKKSFYQREMTSSGTRLRFTVIAVNMETEGQVSWRVFITRSRLTSVPCWPAGICVRLWLSFLSLCLCCSAAAQVCSVDGKPSPLIKPLVRVLRLIWLHHDRQQSCRTEYRMRCSSPVKHWHGGKRMMKCRLVNTKIPWLNTSPVQMLHRYLSKFPMQHYFL